MINAYLRSIAKHRYEIELKTLELNELIESYTPVPDNIKLSGESERLQLHMMRIRQNKIDIKNLEIQSHNIEIEFLQEKIDTKQRNMFA